MKINIVLTGQSENLTALLQCTSHYIIKTNLLRSGVFSCKKNAHYINKVIIIVTIFEADSFFTSSSDYTDCTTRWSVTSIEKILIVGSKTFSWPSIGKRPKTQFWPLEPTTDIVYFLFFPFWGSEGFRNFFLKSGSVSVIEDAPIDHS